MHGFVWCHVACVVLLVLWHLMVLTLSWVVCFVLFPSQVSLGAEEGAQSRVLEEGDRNGREDWV